jgi:hypothetical protein
MRVSIGLEFCNKKTLAFINLTFLREKNSTCQGGTEERQKGKIYAMTKKDFFLFFQLQVKQIRHKKCSI